ncbi:hypothetical protein [Variovorax paradoxus]|uniref:hypothetical protein n=1 Tax=Variovorax paradoxus TaxID=34073 RepID=UPI0019312CCE|nr:hypothetical protein INQ48_43130 [Variovorax paradoxus]
MSLASPMLSAGRPLQEQALALLAFLAARDNVITTPQAAAALDGLLEEPKQAAKELRRRLKALGVNIQHTHALKAVAEARGTGGHLGLGERLQYDVASWSPDAAISCERVRLASFAAAADEVCKRIRENYEDDPPFGALRVQRDELLFIGTSAATGSLWKVLLVPVQPNGKEGAFREVSPLERLAERHRRLVEGKLGGWLDGTYEVGRAVRANEGATLDAKLRTDLFFADQLILEPVQPLLHELPAGAPADVPWSPRARLTQAQWEDFGKRYAFFARRHPETSLAEWVRKLLSSAGAARFEPMPHQFAASRKRSCYGASELG